MRSHCSRTLSNVTVFAGIDLAWSGRKPTGVCVFEAGPDGTRLLSLECTEATCSALEIASLLNGLGDSVVAGIDAPLIISEGRDAEARMARELGRFGVYAYSARADFLERHGIIQGPRLGSMLAGAGWNLDPAPALSGRAGRHAIEVFPHATIVSLLGAPAALKYKKGRVAGRAAALSVFQGLLRAYLERELPALEGVTSVSADASGLAGRALKALEDQLDALACAVAAHHAWKHGVLGTTVFGSATTGYIAVPRAITSSPAPSSP